MVYNTVTKRTRHIHISYWIINSKINEAKNTKNRGNGMQKDMPVTMNWSRCSSSYCLHVNQFLSSYTRNCSSWLAWWEGQFHTNCSISMVLESMSMIETKKSFVSLLPHLDHHLAPCAVRTGPSVFLILVFSSTVYSPGFPGHCLSLRSPF